MDYNISKAVALAALFTLAFAYFGPTYAGGGDYDFHFEKSLNGCENLDSSCEIYAPLFSWVASPFTFHSNAFFFFVVFLFAFVTPMLLFLLSKNWLSVWLYFSITSYYWFVIDGIFAQGLAMILLLLVLVLKDWKHQAIIVLLAITSHGSGFFLVLMAFVVKNLLAKENVKQLFGELKKKNFNKIIPCSGVFGLQEPEILKQPVEGLISTGKSFTVGNLLIPFTKIFPLPYAFFAFRQALRDKNYTIVVLTVITIFAGFWLSHRIFYMLPLLLIPSLVSWVETLKQSHRRIFLLSTLLVFGFQLYSWFNFKLVCST